MAMPKAIDLGNITITADKLNPIFSLEDLTRSKIIILEMESGVMSTYINDRGEFKPGTIYRNISTAAVSIFKSRNSIRDFYSNYKVDNILIGDIKNRYPNVKKVYICDID